MKYFYFTRVSDIHEISSLVLLEDKRNVASKGTQFLHWKVLIIYNLLRVLILGIQCTRRILSYLIFSDWLHQIRQSDQSWCDNLKGYTSCLCNVF